MFGKVFDRMESLKNIATKTDAKLIEGIKKVKKDEIIYMSITELANQLDTSEATIMRFCRKLDYRGFQDFKLSLSQELGDDIVGEKTTFSKSVANSMIDSVMETYKQFDENICNEVAKKIISSRQICAFGVGSSAITPIMLKNRLLRAGINVESASDSHIQTIVASNLTEQDLIILVSVSGATKDIINLAEIAKKNKTPIVIITNYDKSPLVKYADYSFFICKKEGAYEGGSLATIVAQTYVVDVLCTAVFNFLGDKSKKFNLKAALAVSDKSL